MPIHLLYMLFMGQPAPYRLEEDMTSAEPHCSSFIKQKISSVTVPKDAQIRENLKLINTFHVNEGQNCEET